MQKLAYVLRNVEPRIDISGEGACASNRRSSSRRLLEGIS
jgi:hypothetical protein